MERVLVDVYADAASGVPRQVLVPTMPEEVDAVSAYLAEQRGGPVALRVPLRGTKRSLLQTVEQNAKESFVRHRLHRTSDHNSRARALESLQHELGLPEAPLRIECYDMSHLQGTDYVGSMVVFEDGLPKKSDYRHFRVATVPGNDDYAAMEEVLTRRLTSLLADDGPAGRIRRSAPAPSGADRGDDGVTAPGPGPGRARGAPVRAAADQAPLRLPTPTPAAGRRPRAAQRGRPGTRRHSGSPSGSPSPHWPRASRRSTGRDDPSPTAWPASRRGSTCSSSSGTRPTGSPSRTTAPCAASG